MPNVTLGLRIAIDVSFIGSYSCFLLLKVHLLVWRFLYNHFSSAPSWKIWQNLANTDLWLSSINLDVLGVWTHLAHPSSPWQYFWKKYCYCQSHYYVWKIFLMPTDHYHQLQLSFWGLSLSYSLWRLFLLWKLAWTRRLPESTLNPFGCDIGDVPGLIYFLSFFWL